MVVDTPLRDIAKVIRSKNAGPFEITLDIVFKTREDFDTVKRSGVITKELVSQLYNVPTQVVGTELFPRRVRFTGIAAASNLAAVAAGGTAPYAAQWLVHITGDTKAPAWWMIVTGVIATIGLLAAAFAYAGTFFPASVACDYRYFYFVDVAAMAGLIRRVAAGPFLRQAALPTTAVARLSSLPQPTR